MNRITNFLKYAILCMILLTGTVSLQAEEEEYIVYDAVSPETSEVFSTYREANLYYQRAVSEYGNAVLKNGDTVVKMEYGIVEFRVNSGCSLVVDYTSLYRGEEGEINGCYGIDALYGSTSYDGNTVTFYISGDYGSADLEEVILHPFEELSARLSMYTVKAGNLEHDVKTQLKQDYYSISVTLDEAPDYLEEGKTYYSYDGHYFYEDFHLMSDDLRKNVRDHAVNAEDPYYNYYQYLSHRTKTRYEAEEIFDHFSKTLSIDGRLHTYRDMSHDNANDEVNRSQYYGVLPAFFEYQDIYGANALMMLSLSINESSYGKSQRAYTRNNLFGHAAYDSDEERYASRYKDVETSVYSHAKYYISDSYSNSLKRTYNGSFFGNKASGMNVMYSTDPYWGEKAAANYYRLDNEISGKDRDVYAIGIIEDLTRMPVYRDPSCSSVLFTLRTLSDFAFILLEDLGSVYKVQVDPSFHEDYTYDYETSVGYLRKNVFDHLLNEEKIHEEEYVTVRFDADGGEIAGEESVTLMVRKGTLPVVMPPQKEGYSFTGFDHEIETADEDAVYTAQFRKIEKIELIHPIEETIAIGSYPDLSEGRLRVVYEDEEVILPVTTDMLGQFDRNTPGIKDTVIRYCGMEIPVSIDVSEEKTKLSEEIRSKLEETIASYTRNGTYDEVQLAYLKENLALSGQLLSFDEIRYLDEMERKQREYYLMLDDEFHDLSVSGFAFSAEGERRRESGILHDTDYLHCRVSGEEASERLRSVAEGYGFTIEEIMNFSIERNTGPVVLRYPVIIQLKIDDKKVNRNYSVYRLDEEGNVIKCRTTQTAS
ncbi:MAG: glucosaminidase domain-containing protein, partial [Erysipelotrichaceae bacterium]|nr:glucosaminidase domain-containing protein [Erysipelotrichaceae bacterium]